jgi:RNA polymerase sigma-70 factor, ECF subfamily
MEDRAMRSQRKPQIDFPDAELVQRALAGEEAAFRTIMSRHNRLLYRIARSILPNDSEAEDALQEAYISAFTHLGSFRGESALATWLTRITMNEAMGRMRRERTAGLERLETQRSEAQIIQFPLMMNSVDPEQALAQQQILRLVEKAIGNLPAIFRIVFMMRVVEGMSIGETADLLALSPKTVKTRLHRARGLIRRELEEQLGPILMSAFPFAGARCERLTRAVLQRLRPSG